MSGDVHRDRLILTVRVIRSFQHRNIWHIVIRDVRPTESVEEFKKLVQAAISAHNTMPTTVKTYAYDTLKIEHLPHKAKSNDPVINTGDDDKLILSDQTSLGDAGVVNETVLSFFKMDDYLQYKSSLAD